MRYLVASDIHGNVYYTNKLKDLLISEKCDQLILLGDIFNLKESNLEELNSLKSLISAVKGNCDYEEQLSKCLFPVNNYLILNINNKNFFFSHGHLYSPYNIPVGIDVFIYGHTHVYEITKINDLLIANPGSLAYPRNDTPHSYMIIDDNNIIIKDEEGNVLGLKKYH